jgi:hypothetical protein
MKPDLPPDRPPELQPDLNPALDEPLFQPPPALAWLQALRRPGLALDWSLADWLRVVRIARPLRLLARLAEAIAGAGLLASVPAPARRHLVAEQHLARQRGAAMRWTIERVATVLADAPYPRVLLKGAAYVAQGLTIARGRLPSDLDILVPLAHLADAQARLVAAGWSEPALDAHDQRYYREWSHEVPPMTHPQIPLELDLHHNILPPVGHAPVDADRLIAGLMPSQLPGWQVLDPVDQVLHSAAHLFFDSELQDRVRDLVDLDSLLRLFSAQPDFWPRLTARSTELGLAEPLALACHFTTRWLGTPLPALTARAIAMAGPGALQRAWLLPVLALVLKPGEPDDPPALRQALAATLLLARYHWRRMPLRLLLPHLWHKWRGQRQQARDDAAAVPAPQ